MEILYTAKVSVEGGRSGKIKSEDGALDLALSMPKALGGQGTENATNPEQLFAAGYAACFDSALNLVARQERKKVETKVTAEVSIGKDAADGGFRLASVLNIEVAGATQEEAAQLVEQAHKVCPYSKATSGNMDVVIKTTVKD